MNEVIRPIHLQRVTTCPEAARSAWLWKLLSGKNQNNVLPLIAQRHSIGERVFRYDPIQIEAQGFIDIRSRNVKRLVPEGFYHQAELRLGPLARNFGDETDDPRHVFLYPRSVARQTVACACTKHSGVREVW